MQLISLLTIKDNFLKTTSIGLLISFASFQSLAQTPQQKMDTLLDAYVKENKFNGAVLVAQKGNIVYQKGFGFKDAANRQPVDVNTIFQTGSVTKQFTSAIIMQLQQEGRLSLSDKLNRYFIGFTNGDKITIEHLLTHTSGIYNYTNDATWAKQEQTRPRTQAEMLDLFKKYPSDFDPGTNFNYSNSGYSILGYIIEKITKKPYEQVVRERILQPLGMTHSGFDFTHLKSTDKAQGYFSSAAENIIAAPTVDSTISYAAGALYSTLNDMLKWERAIYTNKILRPESWQAVFTAQRRKYGYGWTIDSTFSRFTTAHGGAIPGFTSYLLRFPNEELVVIMFDNTSGTNLTKISRSLAAIMLNEAYELPALRKEIKVDEGVLKQYIGRYQIAPNFNIDISVGNGKISAQATNQPSFELFAEKENKFFLKINDATLEFVKDMNGSFTEVILSQNGRQTKGRKIN